MWVWRWLLLGPAAVSLAAACSGKLRVVDDAGCPGPAFDGGPLDPSLVAAGSALVTQYQCQQCHGTTLSGNDDGVEIPNSSLIQYPPNLTSDPATGLGCWTDDQVANAILDSVDNEGQAICGPMPHFSALGLSQADAASIVVYLRSLPVFENGVQAGATCVCQKDADCPPAESCLSSGSCSCESMPCAIPGAAGDAGGVGGPTTDGGPDGGVSVPGVDGGLEDGGQVEPDAGFGGGEADAGIEDAGVDAGREDAGSDGGAADGGAARDAGLDGGAANASGLDAGAGA
ncbi:MAG: c-type cytochrome [Myxococcales bacterium]